MPIRHFVLLLLVSVTLTACSGSHKRADTYTDRSGATTVIQSSRENCVASCNSDYARCMDTSAAQNDGVNGPAGMFGASAGCRTQLQDCLPQCKGR